MQRVELRPANGLIVASVEPATLIGLQLPRFRSTPRHQPAAKLSLIKLIALLDRQTFARLPRFVGGVTRPLFFVAYLLPSALLRCWRRRHRSALPPVREHWRFGIAPLVERRHAIFDRSGIERRCSNGVLLVGEIVNDNAAQARAAFRCCKNGPHAEAKGRKAFLALIPIARVQRGTNLHCAINQAVSDSFDTMLLLTIGRWRLAFLAHLACCTGIFGRGQLAQAMLLLEVAAEVLQPKQGMRVV